MKYLSILFILMFGLSVFGQKIPPPPLRPGETQEDRDASKKASDLAYKEEKRKAEKLVKKEKKQAKQEAKQEEKAMLASEAEMTLEVSADIAGQALTSFANNQGMTVAAYEEPKFFFGKLTPYRVAYLRRTKGFDEILLAKIALGGLFNKVGDTGLYVAFEIESISVDSCRVRGKIGFVGDTVGGGRYYDMTYSRAARPKLNEFMETVKGFAQK